MLSLPRILIPFACLGLWATSATAVTSLAAVELDEQVIAARASADGKRYIVLARRVYGLGSYLHVFDATDPGELRETGALLLQSPTGISLSADGQDALVVVAAEPAVSSRATEHEVIALDLADPAQPKVRWREHYLARSMALGPLAGRFAYSRPVQGKAGEWQTVVVSGADRRELRVIDEGPAGNDTMALSPQGRFLATRSDGSLRLRSLGDRRFEPDAVDTVTRTHLAPGCLHAVLDSGNVVTTDDTTSRIVLRMPRAGLPRMAVFGIDAMPSTCRPLQADTSGGPLLLAGQFGRVLSVPRPRVTAENSLGEWQLPGGYTPLAAAGVHSGGYPVVLAMSRKRSELRLFRLDDSPPAPVDWRPLEQAHRAGLESLRAGTPSSLSPGPGPVVTQLEAEGIVEAMSAPAAHVPPRRAAAILNDYGFLLAKVHGPPQRVEAALRRSLALDPDRALAHLNLADHLRTGLGRFGGLGGDVTARRDEIESHYRAYLAAGGRPTVLTNSFFHDTPPDWVQYTCARIAAWTNAGLLEELVSDVGVDVSWGSRRVDLGFTAQRPFQRPSIDVFDAESDEDLTDQPFATPDRLADNLSNGDGLGLLRLGGRYHILHYRDWRHPIATTSIDGDVHCRFTVDPQATVPVSGWSR